MARNRSRGQPTLRERFEELRQIFGTARPKTGWRSTERSLRNRFVGDLRDLLARACLEALQPDLIILDEFQRFKHLLAAPDSEGFGASAELAHELFSYVDTQAEHSPGRVMLLSATPYKMLTASGDPMRITIPTSSTPPVSFLETTNPPSPV